MKEVSIMVRGKEKSGKVNSQIKADMSTTDVTTTEVKQRENYNRFTSFLAEMIEKYGADVLAELEA